MSDSKSTDELGGKVFALLTNYIDSPERASNAAGHITRLFDKELERRVEEAVNSLSGNSGWSANRIGSRTKKWEAQGYRRALKDLSATLNNQTKEAHPLHGNNPLKARRKDNYYPHNDIWQAKANGFKNQTPVNRESSETRPTGCDCLYGDGACGEHGE